jgi:predicted acyl esterase
MPNSLKLPRHAALLLAVLLGALVLASVAHADTWYGQAGAKWTQAFISEADGTTLHADVLRPADLPDGARTPVILSIGPYFNHSGQTGPAGPVEGTSYDPIGGSGPQPSDRFKDFVLGTNLIKRGYSYVMVDLRGFGGSSGCLDWAGPGEQSDVKAAVDWAASQAWSTGSVGMYGKSYDAVTGVIGEAKQPAGLKAVVSQEPVYDMYRYLYTNGVRYLNSLATPGLYDAIAATPGPITESDPNYNIDAINDTARPGCAVQNYSDQASNSDHSSAYWKVRDLIAATAGHTIPLFLTQGFLENNTKPDGAWDFFNGLAGPKKAWFGMWDHIRGNDVTEGDNAAPHPWFDQIMRFYDHYVRGLSLADTPTDQDPAVSVETGDGSWRAEQQWPPLDSTGYTTTVRSGTYNDSFNAATTQEQGGQPSNDSLGAGLWTISPPLASDAHFAGVPTANLDVTAQVPNATLSVDVYDIDTKNSALLLSRTAYLLAQGENKISPQLYGNDWLIPAGHRLGVLVTSANDGWWTPAPTQSTVTVNSSNITLPFLSYLRTAHIAGKRPTRLDDWLKNAPFTIDAATVSSSTSPSFALPPAQTAAPAGFNAGAFGEGVGFVPPGSHGQALGLRKKTSRARTRGRVHLRLLWHGSRTLVVYGDAPARWKLKVRARLGRHTAVTRSTRASRFGRFRVALRLVRGRAYVVGVTARGAGGSATASASARHAPRGR